MVKPSSRPSTKKKSRRVELTARRSWKRYYRRMLRELPGIGKGNGITSMCVDVLDGIRDDYVGRIVDGTREMTVRAKRSTVQAVDVQSAVRLALPWDLSQCVRTFAIGRVAAMAGGQDTKQLIPVSKVTAKFRSLCQLRVARSALVYFTAVVEYLMAELIELGSKIVLRPSRKTKRLTTRILREAIETDADFSVLHPTATCALRSAGVTESPWLARFLARRCPKKS